MITVLIADDHEVVRRGMAALLRTERDIQVVGEAENGIDALRLIERLQPLILLCDIRMPGLNGDEVAREVVRRSPRTRVVLVSGLARDHQVAAALRDGASAFVSKAAGADEIVAAIRAVAAGRRYVSSAFSAMSGNGDGQSVDAYETLSARERQVLQLVAEGHTSAEIGERLFISPRTVETHRANVLRKLGLRTHGELVLYAMRRGLIERD